MVVVAVILDLDEAIGIVAMLPTMETSLGKEIFEPGLPTPEIITLEYTQ